MATNGTLKLPAHDATIVEIGEYFAALWKDRATAPLNVGTTQAEKLTAAYNQRVAETTAQLWKLRADQERAMASAQKEATDG